MIGQDRDPKLSVAGVLSALTFALDLTEDQPLGHAQRSCVIGMAIAKEIRLPIADQADLYYALLMKDAGCSTNASKMYQLLGTDDIQAKRDVKTTDWTKLNWESLEYALGHVKSGAAFLERVRALADLAIHKEQNAHDMVKIRCERGASIARRLGLPEATADAIHSLDELWNGRGHPQGLRGKAIPLLARIMNLAQSTEVFFTHKGPDAALDVARKRRGKWFDPDLVKALESAAQRTALWGDLPHAAAKVAALEPASLSWEASGETLDRICLAFADVVDAKSPFTYRHSTGVAGAAIAIGQTLGVNAATLDELRRAALLHDIGKLSVPNSILDKPGKLTHAEWNVVKEHPRYTHEILRRIPGFSGLSEIAASHHEKLDGSGYFRGKDRETLTLNERILVVADIYDALAARRPYREALPAEKVFSIMQADAPRALDADCLAALRYSEISAQEIGASLLSLSLNVDAHEQEVHAPVEQMQS